MPPEEEVKEWELLTDRVKPHTATKQMKPEINQERVAVNVAQRSDVHLGVAPTYDLYLGDKVNIDRNTVKTIDQGKYNIDAVLDLHGYVADKAYLQLERFIKDAVNNNCRLLLIITGKGEVLRSMIMTWLNSVSIRAFILRVSQASNKHGGKGAFYILLKRAKLPAK